MPNEPKLRSDWPPELLLGEDDEEEVGGVINPEMGESPLTTATLWRWWLLWWCPADDSSYMVKLAGESGNEVDDGLDGTLAGGCAPAVVVVVLVLTASRAVGTFLLLRMLSLNLRSIVRRNLRRL